MVTAAISSCGGNAASEAKPSPTASWKIGPSISTESPWGIAASPDGRRVYVVVHAGEADFGSISIIDSVSSSVAATIPHIRWPEDIVITPDGRRAYVVGQNSVSVLNTESNTVSATIEKASGRDIAISPDGSRVYTAGPSLGNSVDIIDTSTNRVAGEIGMPGVVPEAITVAPSGVNIYVAAEGSRPGSGVLSVIDSATDKVTGTVPLPGDPSENGLAVTPDGKELYVSYSQGKRDGVAVVDVKKKAVTDTVPMDDSSWGITVSPDGAYAYVVQGLQPSTFTVIDTASKKIMENLPVKGSPFSVAVAPDGRRAYVSSQETVHNDGSLADPPNVQVIDID
ncbi:YncE family protein [Streptomyces sp. NPDC005794]|uniref:YncE family protein n=1 Tax=Streptomyces sp. NPDC005794 TaxID=3364733 RepID=UPI0036BAFCAD